MALISSKGLRYGQSFIIMRFQPFFSDSSSSSEDEEVQETVAPAPTPAVLTAPLTSTRTPKVKKMVSKMPKPILHVKSIGGKKSQGNRQARRHENSLFPLFSLLVFLPPFFLSVCFLLNMATDLDEDFAEVNINDLVETTVSAFAQLLLSKNKMKVRQSDLRDVGYMLNMLYTLQSLCPLSRGPL
jgi:hypothetical protein